jgi:hypothetical protein
MGGHIEVNGVSPVMTHDHKYKQQAKADSPHYQKVCCYDLLNVVLQKRAPSREGGFP